MEEIMELMSASMGELVQTLAAMTPDMLLSAVEGEDHDGLIRALGCVSMLVGMAEAEVADPEDVRFAVDALSGLESDDIRVQYMKSNIELRFSECIGGGDGR